MSLINKDNLYSILSNFKDKIISLITTCESPIDPTLINSWVNYGNGYSTVGYCKDSLGYVHLKGSVTNGGTSATVSGTVIFQMPESYRPLAIVKFSQNSGKTPTSSVINLTSIEINNIGEVKINTYIDKCVSLDGISFRVGV